MNGVWDRFAEYIISNYGDASLIVEVGVGNILEPSSILKEKLEDCTIKCTDIYPSNDEIIKDDITNPNYEIYENADLIYSIRPPEELQKSISDVAASVECDCILKPFSSEALSFKIRPKFKLINYKKEVFYLMKRQVL
ncbi:MAG: hypothetical protein BZ133_07345 [Methanosphaera sp. SHI613]|jgi:uncharacterized UPF0146 family protein|nr:MAG: hypothetical protein BZ133_07345 [Methanosphaera sp. SHI613]